MKQKHIVIVGGVAGGASAAARARRHSETVRITVIERGPDVSFANCGLPYHIGGEISDREELALRTPGSLRKLLNLRVLTSTEDTAIRGKMTIDDLIHLELSHAPPFGSAKDVINTAGFAATNMRDGFLVPVQHHADAVGGQIVDVRPPESVEGLPVPGATTIPLPSLRDRLDEVDKSRPVFTACQMGKTSYFAARILANNGFDARSILGDAYHQAPREGDE